MLSTAVAARRPLSALASSRSPSSFGRPFAALASSSRSSSSGTSNRAVTRSDTRSTSLLSYPHFWSHNPSLFSRSASCSVARRSCPLFLVRNMATQLNGTTTTNGLSNGRGTPRSRQPNAPSPFIITDGDPLDHLLDGYKVRNDLDIPYAVFEHEIENSPNDDRQHRSVLISSLCPLTERITDLLALVSHSSSLVMLKNGMEVLLISDPKADKAAAAMDVKVGHLSDPEDLQGLAHFCEHLMFMGTEKVRFHCRHNTYRAFANPPIRPCKQYPKENDYTEFLTQHSGSSNAFTGLDQTCYYFDVEPASLFPALDRFAQFFIAPLFDPSCTAREANAVHSENSKNLQSDMWRFFQLDKSTSSKSHAYWRFGTGNKDSLGFEPPREGLDVRERLLDWQAKHYSANICKLVVLAKDPLDVLTRQVVETFSPAPNRHLSAPEFPGSPYSADEVQRILYVKSVKDTRHLELSFPFPDESAYYATKPGSFLSHLIGHEGEGSILSLLKKKGWANSMSAGAGNGARGFEFFKINVDLTVEGLQHHEDVSAVIFAYFDLLRSHPPSEWAFDEVAQLSKLAFRFKEKGSPTNTAMGLALSMSKPFPREKLLSAPWLSTEWNPEIVVDLIGKLKPENCRILVAANEPIGDRVYDQKERWYGTEYTIEPMSDKLLKHASAETYPELHMPKPNAFVPKDIEIKNKTEVEKPAKRPLSLRNTPIARLWYKKDDRWWVPRAGVFVLIRSPIVDDTPLHSVQSRLVTELVRDALAEYSYDAELAGLSYTFEIQGGGIIVTFDGYNDKLPLLAQVVIDKLTNFTIDPERYELIMDQLRRAYTNNRLDQPYNHAMFTAGYLTTETMWTREEQLEELANITVENLTEYKTNIFKRGHIEMLVHGNMLKDEAISMCKMVETTVNPQPLTLEELRSRRALIPHRGDALTRSPVYNPSNDQSAIEQLTYIGNIYDDLERCKLSLFATIVSEPLFDTLRTQQQLGYIVSSGTRRSIGFIAFRLIVQSDRDATYVEQRVDDFWSEYLTVLETMSDEEFGKYRSAVVSKKLEDHKNMWEESSFFWLAIQAGWYDFEQKARDATVVESLTKDDIIDFFKRHFLDKENRRRISVHLNSQRLDTDRLARLGPLVQQMGLLVPQEEMQKLVASRPTLEQLKSVAGEMLKQAGQDEAMVEAVLAQVEQVLTTRTAPDGVKVVEEAQRTEFKNSLEPGPYATPVAEYSDLLQKF
ncbi:BQ5605_C003g02474 [Microbotryum silenes-dioicae]|uniref:BQ5605_C003g02474 protein n=1 Tax=Microbotryum silenes-dioicae TaxID=796604 RepID=A0A2X0M595_9BASI|nr:BQ5605_C003g02474 [Microbotryum silenes-dioicae]